jgi:hypothetical protein
MQPSPATLRRRGGWGRKGWINSCTQSQATVSCKAQSAFVQVTAPCPGLWGVVQQVGLEPVCQLHNLWSWWPHFQVQWSLSQPCTPTSGPCPPLPKLSCGLNLLSHPHLTPVLLPFPSATSGEFLWFLCQLPLPLRRGPGGSRRGLEGEWDSCFFKAHNDSLLSVASSSKSLT